jgi:hypothetical protein
VHKLPQSIFRSGRRCPYLAADIFGLLASHRKYSIAVLKDQKRQLYEEAVALSSISEPYPYENGNTYYRVWEHKIEGLWDSYKDRVTVIRSEETVVAKDRESKAEWMWVTNLPFSADLSKYGPHLPQPVADREQMYRRAFQYMVAGPYLQAQRKCHSRLYPVFIYCS